MNEHDEDCRTLPKAKRMGDLSEEQRQVVFSCRHWSHDVVRKIWLGTWQ